MANNDPMQIDVVLQATDPLNVSLGEMYKGGDGSFAGLSDVALDNPTNGQVPKYNAETEKWENADDNTVSNLTDLEDVNISNPTDGQIVRYDAETDKFIASNEQVGDSVSVTQSLAQGTKVGEISVDGQTTELFAPTPTSPTAVTVTQIQSTGTKIATIEVDGTDTDLFAPNGVPAVHYSTEEQVVGEWIDGSTLYEKTYSISSLSSSSALIDSSITSETTKIRNTSYGSYKLRGAGYNAQYVSHTSSSLFARIVFNTSGLYANIEGLTSGVTASDFDITIRYTKST